MNGFIAQNEVWIAVAEKLNKIQELKSYYTKIEQELKEELRSLSDNKSSEGGDFIFEVTFRAGTVEYARIPELKSVDLDQYRKDAVASWKLYKKLVKPEEI
jgi:hypothetical protein